MNKILVVEDDAQNNRDLCEFLNCSGYEAIGASNSVSAIDIMYGRDIELLIVDAGIPGIDGFEFVRRIRMLDQQIPIIMTNKVDDPALKHKGFSVGADDYMVKPLKNDDVFLRVGALLRRNATEVSSKLSIGDTTLNRNDLTVVVGSEEVHLTTREFNILEKLLSNPRKLLTREAMLSEFWNGTYTNGNRVVDVYITRLRSKFADNKDFEIETVRGLGYRAILHTT